MKIWDKIRITYYKINISYVLVGCIKKNNVINSTAKV